MLLSSTNYYGANNYYQFQQNNPNQFLQNYPNSQTSLTNILLNGLSGGVFKADKIVENFRSQQGFELEKSEEQSFKVLFDKGMRKLRTKKSLYKYVKNIKNPFVSAAGVKLQRNVSLILSSKHQLKCLREDNKEKEKKIHFPAQT